MSTRTLPLAAGLAVLVAAAGIAYLLWLRPGEERDSGGAPPGAAPATSVPEQPPTSVTVYFSRDDSAVAVQRSRPPGGADPENALRSLLAGPTAAEQASGISSWFSDQTAGYLRSFRLDQGGTAHVDFGDLRQVIPSASSSAGSEQLLRELNQTLFRYPEVDAIEYTIDGSCEVFWYWLQYDCQVVRRASSME